MSQFRQDHLIDALDALTAAPRAVLELRYSRRMTPERIAELLDRAPSTVQLLTEEGVAELAQAMRLESIDEGVTLILVLTELPRSAWGDRSNEELVALAQEDLDRRASQGS